MDILTHTIAGFAVGTVMACFSKKGYKEKLFVIGTGGFAGALPDIDAISLWSGFDSTFGRLFNLDNPGRVIYSAKFWYSHHAFMHSIVAAFIISTVIRTLIYLTRVRFRKPQWQGLVAHFKSNRLLYISFNLGFLIHLIEDMPTPGSAWGGVNLFWPSKSYIGGLGDIWWWNNYDIFLIVIGVMVINLTFLAIGFGSKKTRRRIIIGVFSIGFLFSFIQIKSRDFDFAYSGKTNRYPEFEAKSKELQKDILGDRLYKLMEGFDNKLMFYF